MLRKFGYFNLVDLIVAGAGRLSDGLGEGRLRLRTVFVHNRQSIHDDKAVTLARAGATSDSEMDLGYRSFLPLPDRR
ncbi:hypothetical protein [Hyphomonas oceanitis]|uniref:hypothetical protein n=1 Tax=Hyphomonas oceanitis TaxID=81033 RepID=UPI003002AE44